MPSAGDPPALGARGIEARPSLLSTCRPPGPFLCCPRMPIAWFSPDCAELSDATRDAMERGTGLTAAAANEALQLAQPDLRALFRTTQPVIALPGGYPLAREIALRTLIDHRVMVLVAGPEGELLAKACESLGKETIRLMVHPGTVVEPDQLQRFLGGPDVDSVIMVYAELSQGSQLPLEALAAVVKTNPDVRLMVDAIGALGAAPIEMDAWGIDLLLTPSRGPLALPPGFTLASMSAKGVERGRSQQGRGKQLDLASHHSATERGAFLTEISPILMLALRHQLDHIRAEGIESRWSRHAMLRATVEQWVMVRSDLQPIAPAERRAAASTCLRLPPGSSVKRILEGLADEDWPIAPDATHTRDDRLCVGHMGEVTEPELLRLLEAIGRQLDLGR